MTRTRRHERHETGTRQAHDFTCPPPRRESAYIVERIAACHRNHAAASHTSPASKGLLPLFLVPLFFMPLFLVPWVVLSFPAKIAKCSFRHPPPKMHNKKKSSKMHFYHQRCLCRAFVVGKSIVCASREACK